MDIREEIKKKPLLFDGAMGTWYAEHYQQPLGACEPINILAPEKIRSIHEEYIQAGARAIRTNTFGAYPGLMGGADPRAVIEAGWRIAREAAERADLSGQDVHVFADLGPAPAESHEDPGSAYREIVKMFMACGARNFIFETLGTDAGILEAVSEIRTQVPDAFVIVSFGVQPDGFTREGVYYRHLLRRMTESKMVDVTGLNCVSGARHMTELIEALGPWEIPLCALPNVGYPVVRGNRTYFDGDPEYFAAQIRTLTEKGISIVGGCCGTTPTHIGYLHRELEHIPQPRKMLFPADRADRAEPAPGRQGAWYTAADSLNEKLAAGEKVIAVELDSPKDCDVTKFMRGAGELQNAGADILTIADCPVARARMDSSLLACKVHRELGMDVMPHMTCRDRNINASKALLLGLAAEGIQNVLVITGDPIPTSERSEVRTVYQFNSVKMASYLKSLNEEVFPEPFRVFGALNLNAVNFEAEMRKCERKREAGMTGVLTQPVLTEQAFENLKTARRRTDLKILGGIIPVVSERNALFMENEVNGIRVSEKIIQLYRGKSRDESEELAFEISCEIARRIEPYVDGFYLMTPFSRTHLMSRIIRVIRSL